MSTLTVGTIIEKVADAGVAVDGVTLKDGGATFTSDVTIGDASASDKKILFDGNAVDYHIGLDDSADSLIIGKGSALGTTTSMAIDANGIITKPLQPAFSVHKNGGNQNNFAINSNEVVTWASERFDVNSDFDLTNNQFVAPVTGKYFLNASIRLGQFDTSAGYYNVAVVTSNEAYRYIIDPGGFSGDLSFYSMNPAVVADMDAGDTANITIFQSGGAAITDMDGSPEYAYFSGYLVA